MRFYRVDWHESEPSAQQTEWATSRKQAERIACAAGDGEITEVDVPTDKGNLLAFLNEHIWCNAGRAISAARSL